MSWICIFENYMFGLFYNVCLKLSRLNRARYIKVFTEFKISQIDHLSQLPLTLNMSRKSKFFFFAREQVKILFVKIYGLHSSMLP